MVMIMVMKTRVLRNVMMMVSDGGSDDDGDDDDDGDVDDGDGDDGDDDDGFLHIQ